MENVNICHNDKVSYTSGTSKISRYEVCNIHSARSNIITISGRENCHGCCHSKIRLLRTSSDTVLCQKSSRLRRELVENNNILKPTNSISYGPSTKCNNCKNVNNNSSIKSTAEQNTNEEDVRVMLEHPPEYTPPVEIVSNGEEVDSSYCVVHKGAAALIGVLVAIIACLVIALTFFLVSDKFTGGNSPNGAGEENSPEPKVEASINQTGQCGNVPEKYSEDFSVPRTFNQPVQRDFIYNNGTERIIGGVPASIKQYPWQESESPKPLFGRSFIQPRVMGGSDTSNRKIPWKASLWVNGKGQTCGGAVLTKDWIITAAHCTVTNRDVTVWVAYFGETNMAKRADGVKRRIVKIIQHPNYKTDETFDYDLSLMKLDSSLTFTEKVQPVCVPSQGSLFKNSTECYVSGWGATDNSGESILPLMLQHAQVDLFDRNTCLSWLGDWVTERMICAGKENGESDACQGDSGGPLSCYSIENDSWVIVGLVSWGIECGLEQLPGVYTNIAVFTDWIWTAIVKSDQE